MLSVRTNSETDENRDATKSGVDYVMDIVGVSKSFRRRTRGGGYSTLKSAILELLRGRKPAQPHLLTHAIQDMTLRIPRGASVGIIGRNGSGKSTFLKLLTGIYKPDSGSISVKGRIAALIELGAGFHPDFTGRENLYLSGVMHGLTRRQIDDRFDDIVDFAELRHVIDDPVRTYSSGMFMRLGFSIAVHTDPDVLLVDEVLAVGDAGFVAKCKERVSELHRVGKTLLLVTHDLEAVERWCDEAIWLHEGEVRDRGFPRRVIDSYRNFIEHGEEVSALKEVEARKIAEDTSESAFESGVTVTEDFKEPRTARWGSREIEILTVDLKSEEGASRRVVRPEDRVVIHIAYQKNAPVTDVVFGVGINRLDGVQVYGTNTDIERLKLGALNERGVVEFDIGRLGLLEGSYEIDVAVHRIDGYPFDYHKCCVEFLVRSEVREVGVFRPMHIWRVDGRDLPHEEVR